MSPRDDDWEKRAACAVSDPELFFPNLSDTESAEQAKRICARCPVSEECLEKALRTGDNEHGIRAGLTPKQRQKLLDVARSRKRVDRDAVDRLVDLGNNAEQVAAQLHVHPRTIQRIVEARKESAA